MVSRRKLFHIAPKSDFGKSNYTDFKDFIEGSSFLADFFEKKIIGFRHNFSGSF
tara:strand:+ start:174 stop:335 length:162 start_codon:yes stop_codon:yes gene_type:complete